MKVYDAAIAPNPRRVRWVMAEKGITDIEVIPVSIPEGEHKRPDYLAKAGLPNLPMLEMDDGTTITESIAICRYLESRYPEPNLFGRLTNRLCVGNLVIDQEIVTRTFPEGPGELDVIAMYEVEGGKIANAWFKFGHPRLTSAL